MAGAFNFAFVQPTNTYGPARNLVFSSSGLHWLLLATVVCTVMTYIRARQKDFAAHRRWALRVGTLLLAAPIYRIFTYHIMPRSFQNNPGMGPMSEQEAFQTLTAINDINWYCWVPFIMA